ncbi:MAG TPA: tRNA lysidine(34) synthetase TilS [Limnobacter sp.]|nr:tRNA lysidine(34) synthetase TilS [Limnobacter sp.]
MRATSNHAVADAVGAFVQQAKHLPQPWVVGLSGGLDSTVLVHALRQSGLAPHALHVNHHLQTAAQDWPAQCRAVCDALGVPLDVLDVTVDTTKASLEAEARHARYHAMGEWMQANSRVLLLCAHHQDDQIETVLIQLLRGQGLRGLAGMPTLGGWPVALNKTGASPWLGRPLLGLCKSDLQAYALQHGLGHVEDPSNSDLQIRRNWLRQVLLPQVETQFPQARHGILNLAAYFQAHYQEHDERTANMLAQISSPTGQLRLQAWGMHSVPVQRDLLHAWLKLQGVRCGQAKLLELQRQLGLPQGGKRQVAQGWWVQVRNRHAKLLKEPV